MFNPLARAPCRRRSAFKAKTKNNNRNREAKEKTKLRINSEAMNCNDEQLDFRIAVVFSRNIFEWLFPTKWKQIKTGRPFGFGTRTYNK